MTEKELTVGSLIKDLKKYPKDTPLWPEFKMPNGFMLMLDFDFTRFTSLDGVSHELHLVFKKSEIYELKKENIE